jgi:hypothetical protein
MSSRNLPFFIFAIIISARLVLASPQFESDRKEALTSNAAGRRRAALPATRSLTPEVSLGDNRFRSYGPAVVAFGMSGGLALWEASDDTQAKASYPLMESPISSTGDLVNPVGKPLPLPSEHVPGRVAISFFTHSDTGIVAWIDNGGKAFAARIGTDGQLLDPQPLLLPDIDVSQVSVTCGDHDCLVLWLNFGDFYGNGGMKGTRVTTTGSLLDPLPLDFGGWQSGISAVWTGTEYWIARNTIMLDQTSHGYFQILEVLPLRASGLGSPIASVDSHDPSIGKGSIAWNGFEGLMAWYSTVSDSYSAHNEIRYGRIDSNGRLLDGAQGILIGTAPPPLNLTDSGSPTPWDGQVTWDGTAFIVTWEGRQGSTFFERITSAGQRLDGDLPNAGFSLPAPAPAAVVGIGQGRTVISYYPYSGPSRIRVMQE